MAVMRFGILMAVIVLFCVAAGAIHAQSPDLFALNITDQPNTLETYDSDTGDLLGSWALPDTNNYLGVAYDQVNDSVWIADFTSVTLYEFDRDDGTVLGSFTTASMLRGVAYDPRDDTLWTGHAGTTGQYINWTKAGVEIRSVNNVGAVDFVTDMDLDPRDGTLWCHDAQNELICQLDITGATAVLLDSCAPPYSGIPVEEAIIVDLESQDIWGWAHLDFGPTILDRDCTELSSFYFENFEDDHNGGDFADFYVSPTPEPTETPSPTATTIPTITPTMTPTATDTPAIPPTITPSPTHTLTPTVTPSHTPTITPTMTPTSTYTSAPTPTFPPTATATPTPECGETGVEMELSQSAPYRPGDTFWLKAHVCNRSGDTLLSVPTFVLLDVFGSYYFWPGWTETADWENHDYAEGLTLLEIIPAFTWPDVAPASGINFYGAMLNEEMNAVRGQLGFVTFSWTR